jgi:septum formation protein
MTAAPQLWLAGEPLLLASGSATRLDMLRAAGVPVDAVAARIDERAIEAPLQEAGASAAAIAAALARAKALAVSQSWPGRVVLGADQTLTCEGISFHKPEDSAAAAGQIAALAGKPHELHSAFALAQDGAVLAEGVSSARLTMRGLTPDFIATYLAEIGPLALASVGGYQIEGPGAQLFESIEGDHFTILGLPLLRVLATLRDLGLLAR